MFDEFPDNGTPKYFGVLIKQAGGKYGSFTCPKCKTEDQYWKFSANDGFCESCNTGFQAIAIMHAAGDKTKVSHRCTIEEK